MMSKLQRFIFWTLSTRTSPLAYLVAYSSLAIGFFWTFFISLPDIQNTLIYKEGLVIGSGVWGIALFVGSLILMYGLRFKSCYAVKIGSMTNFVMWTFAAFLYVTNEYWYAFVAFALFHLLCQGYLFLSVSLNRLWDN